MVLETDQKELGEEEAETGMEMENEFDGEMFDVPDKDNEILFQNIWLDGTLSEIVRNKTHVRYSS